MAETLLSFGVQKLFDLLASESQRLQGFDKQFDELKKDLNLLKLFLEDADAKKHKNKLVKICVEEINEIVFDAEDLIETFLLKKEVGKTSISKRMRRLSCIVVDRMKIISDMGGISNRISKVICDMKNYGVQEKIVQSSMYSHPVQEIQRESRKTFPSNNENDLVGLEENVKKLVGYLVEEDSIQVVSITGMGGIGKTSLARQGFNHEMVKNHFDGFAWVCISQQFEPIYVWKTIMQQLSPNNDEQRYSNMTEEVIHAKLFQLLETSNSLIVIDDMWKEEDWDTIKSVFPSKKGWKVIFTSRNERVALHADPTCVTIKPECLTTEKSWILFLRIAFPKEDTAEFKIDEEMKELGEEMIKHCGGLPLAIKVLGGMLAKKYTPHDWRRLSKNIGSYLAGKRIDFNEDNNESCNYVLSLSFEELPSYLKHCFLYLAHFPEDHKIGVKKLYYYWAAEGIFDPRHYDGHTIQDVGDNYIEELVRRNMVISEREATTLRFKTCHLHDMMRQICLLKAEEVNFLQITSSRHPTANFQSSATSRRLVLQYPTTLHVGRDINNPKLRSLVVVQDYYVGDKWTLSCSSYTRLKLLRVLDLRKAMFKGKKLGRSIGKLIHLRYLSLEHAKVSHIPSSLGNLKLLIYLNLNLDICESVFVPNVLMGMQELRYLALPKKMGRKTKLELSNLVKLETLENFSTKNSRLENLRGMVRLRTLTIEIIEETSLETLSASIAGMKDLEYLTIEDHGAKGRTKEEGNVLHFVHLKKLRLRMYMPRLSKEQHFPSHLTNLYLESCRLEEDPMPILEKLVQLKGLLLRNDSFSGRTMVCSSGGFPQLHMLVLEGLDEWEEWIVHYKKRGRFPTAISDEIPTKYRETKHFVGNSSVLWIYFRRNRFVGNWSVKVIGNMTQIPTKGIRRYLVRKCRRKKVLIYRRRCRNFVGKKTEGLPTIFPTIFSDHFSATYLPTIFRRPLVPTKFRRISYRRISDEIFFPTNFRRLVISDQDFPTISVFVAKSSEFDPFSCSGRRRLHAPSSFSLYSVMSKIKEASCLWVSSVAYA